jgi:hypothetical protein
MQVVDVMPPAVPGPVIVAAALTNLQNGTQVDMGCN